MGNFLVLVPEVGAEIDPLLDAATAVASSRGAPPSGPRHRSSWSAALRFPRADGSGAPIARDEATGSWLLSTGTWFSRSIVSTAPARAADELLRRYLEVGAEAVADELEGFFVVAVGDGRTREVRVITDLVGSCHCYARSLPDVLALSSSSLLLASLHDPPDPDPVGAQEFLFRGTIYEDRTLFREIEKLGPASIFRFADGAEAGRRRYWDPRRLDGSEDPLDGEAAVEVLAGALRRAARAIGRRHDRPACDLTGGYDSRAVAAALRDAGVPFTAVVSGSEASADVRISRRLAAAAELPHRVLSPPAVTDLDELSESLWLTDGEVDLVEYSRVARIHRSLAGEFDVSLNGSFGELARGYWWELLVPRTGRRVAVDPGLLARRRYAASPHDPGVVREELRLDLTDHLTEVVGRALVGASDLPNTRQLDAAYLELRMQRWQGRIASSTNRIWPCISPFMLRPVLEAVLRAAPRSRRRGLLVRRYLARRDPVLAGVPLEAGHPAEPASWRNLHRFLPFAVRTVGEGTEKAIERVLERAGLGRAGGAGTGRRGALSGSADEEPDRIRLWRDPAVRELLRPGNMAAVAAGLLDPDGLARFLERSRGRAFPHDGEWGRILTLELALLSCRRTCP